MNKIRLGVNIDHVATLREARGEYYPEIERAAKTVMECGAEQITIHLREDRRHIRDHDLPVVRKVTTEYGKLFNLEMGANPEIIKIAIKNRPDWVCLVPENREEVTTEGGLNLMNSDVFDRVSTCCSELKLALPELKISLFLESNIGVLEKAKELQVDAVEIHTGEYAKLFLEKQDYQSSLNDFLKGITFLKEAGIHAHAGHGLTLESVLPLLEQNLFEEYNIGHWIIAESVFEGLDSVVRRFVQLFSNSNARSQV